MLKLNMIYLYFSQTNSKNIQKSKKNHSLKFIKDITKNKDRKQPKQLCEIMYRNMPKKE